MVLTSLGHCWLCIVSPTVAFGVPPRAPGPVEEGLAVQLQGLALLPGVRWGVRRGTMPSPSKAQSPAESRRKGVWLLDPYFPDTEFIQLARRQESGMEA